jgi:hypothetical protein
MKTISWHHRFVMIVSLLAMPILTGAEATGCSGGEVTSGGDDCVVGGCSGQSCIEPDDDRVTTCEWREEYACYKQHGICERNASDACGWRPSQALQDCIAEAQNTMANRTPVSGACIRNTTDACSTDADCKSGGCGGELCHGVANGGISTCDCTAPQGVACGCVNGTCSWWQ